MRSKELSQIAREGVGDSDRVGVGMDLDNAVAAGRAGDLPAG